MPLIMPATAPGDGSTARSETSSSAIEPAPSTIRPHSLAIALPHIIHTTLHIQVTRLETSIMIFLTASDLSSSPASSALGSFVYAMPNRFQPAEPLCTSLYSITGTIDFALRVAKIITRRTGKPVYVGCSALFPAADVEEEMGALSAAIDGIMSLLGKDEGA